MKDKNSKENKKTDKEPIVVLILYLLFFGFWYLTAYGFGNDAGKYKFIFGMPEWFFYSCIVGYIGICILLYIAIKFFFADTSLIKDKKGKD
ncbi:MAG: YhdT family protein [Synergistaceae bacterium]|nr:YhdT family protein [Synergistaceae bacterium]